LEQKQNHEKKENLLNRKFRANVNQWNTRIRHSGLIRSIP